MASDKTLSYYSSIEAIEQAISQATHKCFQSYIETTVPTLSDGQEAKLRVYLQSLAAK